ncbi:acyl-CoA N-acyltransferase [Nitzschia inconspicua]|uniref:Acyl-CoA N-acyltransferase n=1 Tax=Nitzschia inconspicua TaxID=303405 RepID=A0A9K3Q3G1_9STRA|nr:acyl-CoA N-acyltransferase [Nitzschia inconspicua]
MMTTSRILIQWALWFAAFWMIHLPKSGAFSLGAPFQKTLATFKDAVHQVNTNRKEITVEVAQIPEDLPGIRACRSTVDFAQQTTGNLLASQKSFLNATALTDPKLNAICVIARNAQGSIVGTTDCRVGKSEVVVNNVLVRPDQRGQGIGEKMMVGVEELIMPSASTTKLTLNVYTDNKPAVRLYEKCGFAISDPANAAVFGLSKLTGANLQVAMSKTIKR